MKIISPATRLIALILLCGLLAQAQEAAPKSAPQLSEKEFGTVYVYRKDYDVVVLWFLTKTLPVYFTEDAGVKQRKIAGLRKKSYFMLRLPPGDYFFDTTRMRGKLKLEVAAGGEYYLRLDQGQDCPSNDCMGPSDCEDRNPSVEIMSPERGRQEILKVKPIQPKHVRDRKLVIIPPGQPANDRVQPTAG